MKVLVINAGSSSLKYQLIDMDGEKVLEKGTCGRIGLDGEFAHKIVKKLDLLARGHIDDLDVRGRDADLLQLRTCEADVDGHRT